jgi:hypothetical protein
VLATCGSWFDLFAVHLCDDPAQIPHHIETVRAMMRAHGHERPVIVGEYNGPTLFQLPDLEHRLHEVMASTFADTDTGDGGELSTETLAASANVETRSGGR